MNRFHHTLTAVVGILAIAMATDAIAQSFERIPYSAPTDWTVTTYKSRDTGAFLRCSAERHYDNGETLTIAKNAAGMFVLGFTSDKWEFEDRATTEVEIQVDTGQAISLAGRGRLLPSGPMLFVDADPTTSIIDDLSKGNRLAVGSGETSLTLNLVGSSAAIAGVNQCHLDGTNHEQRAE
jgi:hypothetical protein